MKEILQLPTPTRSEQDKRRSPLATRQKSNGISKVRDKIGKTYESHGQYPPSQSFGLQEVGTNKTSQGAQSGMLPMGLAVLPWLAVGLATWATASGFSIWRAAAVCHGLAIHVSWCGFGSGCCPSSLVLECRVTLPHGAEHAVPYGEEGLRVVGLDAPALVMDVVIGSVIARQVLERVPRKRVAAVVINSLDIRSYKETHAHSGGQEGCLVGDGRTERIEDETLDGVIV